MCDVFHILYFVFVEVEQKPDESIKGEVSLISGQSNECQNQRVLLLDLVDYDVLAPGLSELVVENCAWDGSKKKHVEENEDKNVDRIWLIILHCQDLVVRIVIIRGQSVHLEDHLAEIIVVGFVLIESIWGTRLHIFGIKSEGVGANENKGEDDSRVIEYENDDIFVSRRNGDECPPHFGVKGSWDN